MSSYQYDGPPPAARSASEADPWRCPWCGKQTWIRSAGDVSADPARMQMYCDNSDCVSRETELIIRRGEGVNFRADNHALDLIDDGAAAGEKPQGDVNLMSSDDMAEMDRREDARVGWRQSEEPFQITPGSSD